MTGPQLLRFPAHLEAPGSAAATFREVARLEQLPPGAMLRVSSGDLDVLLVHTPEGIVATDDRCPHMAAPLSAGSLDGCIVACPLHRGRFDLRDGETVVFPTTGGIDADGRPRGPWTPAGSEPRPEPSDAKAHARALTRVRRMRFYPLRIVAGGIEVAIPG